MQKKRTGVPISNLVLLKFWKIMRLCVFFLTLFVAQTFATVTYSQQTLLTIKMQGAKVIDVLSKIEDESEFFFLFNQKLLDVERQVNVDVKNENIGKILSGIFEKTNVTFFVKDRLIILTTGASSTESDFEQQSPLKGRVTDVRGEPLPGVSVVVKGTTRGVITNADGEYSLGNTPTNATLQFSFVGMKSQEIQIGKRSTINVVMEEETIGIEEVVAVGYGTTSHKKLTTSVTSLKSKQIDELPITNIADAFSGQISGVLAENGVGTPGASPVIRIRGYGSINAGSEPLYVIDGMMANSTQFAALNPKSIESVDILKDAAAGAIYGSRAGNGVILVTTKKGKAGDAKFSFNATYGLQQVDKTVDVLDRDQFLEYSKESYVNDGKTLPSLLAQDPSNYANTNWQNEIFRTSPFQNYQIAATGSSGKIQYYISANILDNEGIVLTTSSKNYSSTGNIDIELNPKLKIGLTYNASHTRQRVNDSMSGFGHGGGGYGISGGIIQQALWFIPILPVYEKNGDYGQNVQGDLASVTRKGYANPVCNLVETHDMISKENVMGRLYLNYELLKGLSLNTSFSGTLYSYFREWNVSPYLAGTSSIYANFSNPMYDKISAGQSNGMTTSWTGEAYLNYKHTVAEHHHFDFILGCSRQYNGTRATSASSSENDRGSSNALDPIDAYENYYLPNIYGAALVLGGGSYSENAFESAFSRLNYDYKDKYIFMGSIRRDGSSKFAPAERWGIFPAISGAWRVAQEPFMGKFNWINEFKIRTSYGVSGNDQFGNYAWQGNVKYSSLYTYGPTSSGSAGTGKALVPSTIENSHLKWETNEQIDVGADISLFDNRINLTADYFIRKTKDMLLYRSLPLENGIASSLFDNIGNMTNRGIELALNTVNIKSNNFTWTTNFTFTKVNNKVDDVFTSTGDIRYDGGTTANGFNSAIRIIEGHPVFEIYSYKVLGTFETQEQLSSYPRAGNAKIGDPIIEDYKEDNVINTDDLQPMGHALADFTYGCASTLKYKNFDLTILIDGSYGASKVVSALRQAALMRPSENTSQTFFDNRYQKDKTGNYMAFPSISAGTGPRTWNMSYFIYDASFTRIKNLVLGYNLPGGICSKIGVNDLRVSVGVQNLFTFTDYPLYNPQTNSYNGEAGTAQFGVDVGEYPLSRIYSIGLNLNF